MNSTSESLLQRLSNRADSQAWGRFVSLYAPLIFYWGRQAGLQAADASDLVQEVLAIVYRRMPTFRYDPGQSFRGWLRSVTINRFRQMLRAKRRNAVMPLDSQIGEIADGRDLESSWDQNYQVELVKRAMGLLRADFAASTWAGLQDWILHGKSAESSARDNDVSVWTLYSARSRLFARIKSTLEGLLD